MKAVEKTFNFMLKIKFVNSYIVNYRLINFQYHIFPLLYVPVNFDKVSEIK